jgi:hypothetical protein
MDHSVQDIDTDGWNSKLCGAFFGSPTSVSARIRASSHSLTTSTAMDSDSDISIDIHSLQVMVLHRSIGQSLGLIEYKFPGLGHLVQQLMQHLYSSLLCHDLHVLTLQPLLKLVLHWLAEQGVSRLYPDSPSSAGSK